MENASAEGASYVLRVLELFAEYGDAEAIVDANGRLSYADLRRGVLELAAGLREQGVQAGDTVAVLLLHPPEAPTLQLALHAVGCRVAWITMRTGRGEIDNYLDQVRPDVILYDTRDHEYDELGRELAAARTPIRVLCLGPSGPGPDLLTGPAGPPADPATFRAGRAGSVFQTSGTTGVPKAILHGQECFRQVVRLGEAWVADGHPTQRYLSTTPLWWASGTVSALITLSAGGTLVLLGEYEPPDFLAAVARERINFVFLPPPMLYLLLDQLELAGTDTSSLYMLNLGGAPVSRPRLLRGIEHFGPVLRLTYGLSESPYVSANYELDTEPEHANRLGSVGRAWGDVRIQIRSIAGDVLGPGETGEIWVSSKLNLVEYVGQPELTATTLVDGWLRTGDHGHLDVDGYLYLAGRANEMIITGYGARNIFARPIEELIAADPRVSAVAVIGVPDPVFGEVVHAFVVPAGDAEPDLEAVRAMVTGTLPEIWAPSSIDLVNSLPLTGFGKVDKKTLLARYHAARAEPSRTAAAASPAVSR